MKKREKIENLMKKTGAEIQIKNQVFTSRFFVRIDAKGTLKKKLNKLSAKKYNNKIFFSFHFICYQQKNQF